MLQILAQTCSVVRLAYFIVAANHVTKHLLRETLAYVMAHAKVKIISMCLTHFLAEYFVGVLQVFAAFILFYFVLRVQTAFVEFVGQKPVTFFRIPFLWCRQQACTQ